MNKIKKFILAVGTLAGGTIGVGIFSLPYVASKVGGWLMLGYFISVSALVLVIHHFFCELSLAAPDYKRLPGFAAHFLGKRGEKVALAATIFGAFGTLLAYLVVGGHFLAQFFGPIFGGNDLIFTLLYFVLGAAMIISGIKTIAGFETFSILAFIGILFAIFLRSLGSINTGNLFPAPDMASLFLPYGPILFSIWGATMIPEAEEMLGENKHLLKKAVLTSSFIAAFIYLFFIFIVLGVCGSQTTPSALPGLNQVLGNGIITFSLLFGFLTTFTAFTAIGLTLKKVFWYDLKMGKYKAWLIACFVPLLLYLSGIQNFISIISFIGGILLGVDGILILLMYLKLKPDKKIIVVPLAAIFLAGILYEIFYFIK